MDRRVLLDVGHLQRPVVDHLSAQCGELVAEGLGLGHADNQELGASGGHGNRLQSFT